LVVDPSLRVIAANRSSHDAFSRTNVSLVDRRLSEIFRDSALHEAFRSALTSGKSSDVRLELIFSGKRTYDTHIGPLVHNNINHAIGFFYDKTNVERLERVRQEFLSNISHELRTPLTSIMAFVETLEDGAIDDSDNNRRFLNVIRRNAERMHCLISDISELSMIESGAVSIEKGHVRLANIVDDIFQALSSKAAERGVHLSNYVSPKDRVYADPTRLEQMLTNLIDNAIKFNVVAGTVEVSAILDANTSSIFIVDTGEGIIPEQASRIFERFYRVDRGRTRDIGGTGLGLAIVKHLTKLHGGEINVESKLGEGTKFTVTLPNSPAVLQ
jgi:two-component system phosphate regulon sensor histidine kinase PhoR